MQAQGSGANTDVVIISVDLFEGRAFPYRRSGSNPRGRRGKVASGSDTGGGGIVAYGSLIGQMQQSPESIPRSSSHTSDPRWGTTGAKLRWSMSPKQWSDLKRSSPFLKLSLVDKNVKPVIGRAAAAAARGSGQKGYEDGKSIGWVVLDLRLCEAALAQTQQAFQGWLRLGGIEEAARGGAEVRVRASMTHVSRRPVAVPTLAAGEASSAAAEEGAGPTQIRGEDALLNQITGSAAPAALLPPTQDPSSGYAPAPVPATANAPAPGSHTGSGLAQAESSLPGNTVPKDGRVGDWGSAASGGALELGGGQAAAPAAAQGTSAWEAEQRAPRRLFELCVEVEAGQAAVGDRPGEIPAGTAVWLSYRLFGVVVQSAVVSSSAAEAGGEARLGLEPQRDRFRMRGRRAEMARFIRAAPALPVFLCSSGKVWGAARLPLSRLLDGVLLAEDEAQGATGAAEDRRWGEAGGGPGTAAGPEGVLGWPSTGLDAAGGWFQVMSMGGAPRRIGALRARLSVREVGAGGQVSPSRASSVSGGAAARGESVPSAARGESVPSAARGESVPSARPPSGQHGGGGGSAPRDDKRERSPARQHLSGESEQYRHLQADAGGPSGNRSAEPAGQTRPEGRQATQASGSSDGRGPESASLPRAELSLVSLSAALSAGEVGAVSSLASTSLSQGVQLEVAVVPHPDDPAGRGSGAVAARVSGKHGAVVARAEDGRGAAVHMSRAVRLAFPPDACGSRPEQAGVRVRLLAGGEAAEPLLEGWVQLELLRVAQRMGEAAEAGVAGQLEGWARDGGVKVALQPLGQEDEGPASGAGGRGRSGGGVGGADESQGHVVLRLHVAESDGASSEEDRPQGQSTEQSSGTAGGVSPGDAGPRSSDQPVESAGRARPAFTTPRDVSDVHGGRGTARPRRSRARRGQPWLPLFPGSPSDAATATSVRRFRFSLEARAVRGLGRAAAVQARFALPELDGVPPSAAAAAAHDASAAAEGAIGEARSALPQVPWCVSRPPVVVPRSSERLLPGGFRSWDACVHGASLCAWASSRAAEVEVTGKDPRGYRDDERIGAGRLPLWPLLAGQPAAGKNGENTRASRAASAGAQQPAGVSVHYRCPHTQRVFPTRAALQTHTSQLKRAWSLGLWAPDGVPPRRRGGSGTGEDGGASRQGPDWSLPAVVVRSLDCWVPVLGGVSAEHEEERREQQVQLRGQLRLVATLEDMGPLVPPGRTAGPADLGADSGGDEAATVEASLYREVEAAADRARRSGVAQRLAAPMPGGSARSTQLRATIVDPLAAAKAWYGARWRLLVAGAQEAARALGMAPGLAVPQDLSSATAGAGSSSPDGSTAGPRSVDDWEEGDEEATEQPLDRHGRGGRWGGGAARGGSADAAIDAAVSAAVADAEAAFQRWREGEEARFQASLREREADAREALQREFEEREEERQADAAAASGEVDALERRLRKALVVAERRASEAAAAQREAERTAEASAREAAAEAKRVREEAAHRTRMEREKSDAAQKRAQEAQEEADRERAGRREAESQAARAEARVAALEERLAGYAGNGESEGGGGDSGPGALRRALREAAEAQGRAASSDAALSAERERRVRGEGDLRTARAQGLRLAREVVRLREALRRREQAEVSRLRVEYLAREGRYELDGDRARLAELRGRLEQVRAGGVRLGLGLGNDASGRGVAGGRSGVQESKEMEGQARPGDSVSPPRLPPSGGQEMPESSEPPAQSEASPGHVQEVDQPGDNVGMEEAGVDEPSFSSEAEARAQAERLEGELAELTAACGLPRSNPLVKDLERMLGVAREAASRLASSKSTE